MTNSRELLSISDQTRTLSAEQSAEYPIITAKLEFVSQMLDLMARNNLFKGPCVLTTLAFTHESSGVDVIRQMDQNLQNYFRKHEISDTELKILATLTKNKSEQQLQTDRLPIRKITLPFLENLIDTNIKACCVSACCEIKNGVEYKHTFGFVPLTAREVVCWDTAYNNPVTGEIGISAEHLSLEHLHSKIHRHHRIRNEDVMLFSFS